MLLHSMAGNQSALFLQHCFTTQRALVFKVGTVNNMKSFHLYINNTTQLDEERNRKVIVAVTDGYLIFVPLTSSQRCCLKRTLSFVQTCASVSFVTAAVVSALSEVTPLPLCTCS